MMSGPCIARIDIDSGDYATDKGAKVGDSEARVKRVYKGRCKVLRHKYLDDGHYIEIEIGGRVVQYYFGR